MFYKQEQLGKLMRTLDATYPHFVRCIIPNEVKTGGILDANLVLHQLHCNGVLEGIRICRKGYPSRMSHQDFLQRYFVLAPAAARQLENEPAKAAAAILETVELDTELYRIGLTKVLFKAGVIGQLEQMRDHAVTKSIVVIQNYVRQYYAKMNYMNLLVKQLALSVLQRNFKMFLEIKSWSWWKLFQSILPYIEFLKLEVNYF
jgi:myosin heavy chain 6/7